MADYKIGDRINPPPEPRVGTYIRIGKLSDLFRMRRYDNGWAVVGASGRRIPWLAVCETWLFDGIWIDALPAWEEKK